MNQGDKNSDADDADTSVLWWCYPASLRSLDECAILRDRRPAASEAQRREASFWTDIRPPA